MKSVNLISFLAAVLVVQSTRGQLLNYGNFPTNNFAANSLASNTISNNLARNNIDANTFIGNNLASNTLGINFPSPLPVSNIASQIGNALGSNGLAANSGLFEGITASNGGVFSVTSTSPITPRGLSVYSENLVIEGPVTVSGMLPFLGAVSLEGSLPTNGQGAANCGCGDGNVGIVSELTGMGRGYAPGYNGLGMRPGYPGVVY